MITSISMPLNREIHLNPCVILNDGLLHVNIAEGHFPDREYFIRNQTGNIIRKGMVGSQTSSFSLRITGFQKGAYEFIMCNQCIQFTIY